MLIPGRCSILMYSGCRGVMKRFGGAVADVCGLFESSSTFSRYESLRSSHLAPGTNILMPELGDSRNSTSPCAFRHFAIYINTIRMIDRQVKA